MRSHAEVAFGARGLSSDFGVVPAFGFSVLYFDFPLPSPRFDHRHLHGCLHLRSCHAAVRLTFWMCLCSTPTMATGGPALGEFSVAPVATGDRHRFGSGGRFIGLQALILVYKGVQSSLALASPTSSPAFVLQRRRIVK